MVVFNCILEEKALIQHSKSNLRNTSSLPNSPTSTSLTRTGLGSNLKVESKPTAIGLYFETELKQKVNYQGQSFMLSGLADYSLGYQQRGSGSGNLVVVEAKKRYKLGKAYGQLLAYMGLLSHLFISELKLIYNGSDDSQGSETSREDKRSSIWGRN